MVALAAAVLAVALVSGSVPRAVAITELIRAERGDRIAQHIDLYHNARARAVALARVDRFDGHAGAGAIPAARWRLWGEIVGWHTRNGATPAWYVDAWLASPNHRRVMLARRWDALGASCAAAASGQVWCVVVFGDRR